jgi:hypothetical protein
MNRPELFASTAKATLAATFGGAEAAQVRSSLRPKAKTTVEPRYRGETWLT